MNIKTLSLVLAILDGSRHCQEPSCGLLSDEAGLLVTMRIIIVLEAHGDSMTSDGIRLCILYVEDLNGLLICIDSRQITLSKYLHWAERQTSFETLVMTSSDHLMPDYKTS